MALTALWARGALKFVVSQNCDGLHVRAGLPRRALASLHGDMYAERCGACRAVYLRACDVTQRTARHRHGTRRLCHACGAELRDTIVHFGERGRAAWPLNWAGALRHAARADVVLCLGSSLKVLRRYARLWRMQEPPARRPRLYIVNLQWTPKDKGAALKINARCDAVMRSVARRLRLRVPRYSAARDPLLAHAEPLAPPERHTTRRPLLSPAPPTPSLTPPHSPDPYSTSASCSTSDSASASDSDDEVPLRRLADRLRSSPSLRSFRVKMETCDATILLRAEHAGRGCSPLPPPPPPPPLSLPLRLTSELRRVRIARHAPHLNGHGHSSGDESWKFPPRGGDESWKFPPRGEKDAAPRLRRLLELAAPEAELAAAFFARAVLLCRAQLYPGLHTILAAPAPPAPAPAAAPVAAAAVEAEAEAEAEAESECAWCWRVWRARRCLWYGAPRRTPLSARAWRRVGARRYLCACCGDDRAEGPAAEGGDADGGGWYGKGYRKGRRRGRR